MIVEHLSKGVGCAGFLIGDAHESSRCGQVGQYVGINGITMPGFDLRKGWL
jgi:hypothetical protein